MIDFKNKKIFKLKPDDMAIRCPNCLWGMRLVASYKSMRDGIVFTDKRMIIVIFKALPAKVDYTSILTVR